MYRSKESLVRFGARYFGKRLSTSSTYNNLINPLVDLATANQNARNNNEEESLGGLSTSPDTVDDQEDAIHEEVSVRRPSEQQEQRRQLETPPVTDAIIKAVLKKSFMKHLKGQARDHCQMGHKLELPIAKDFMSDVNEKKKLGGDVKIISVHKVGLVGKKMQPWAKDSIDFIACVLEANQLKLWGVEVKSRQTVSTVTRERENMRKLRRKKYEEIDTKKVSAFLYKRDERFQLLHHAFVYSFDKVVLIVGDNGGKVINATVVTYDTTTLESYGKVIETLKEKVLGWAYNEYDDVSDVLIPENIVNLCNDISAINCREALYSNLKLWKRMFQDTFILPRPTLTRIIPRSHAKWNTGKPGSDTITKIVDDCVFTPPKEYTNYESKASGRCFSNLTSAILRMFQISTAKKDFTRFYPTLDHYRNAASHRCTHKKLLRTIHRIYKKTNKRIVSHRFNNNYCHCK